MKKVQFNKINPSAGLTGFLPAPSQTSLPKWYKDLPSKLANHFARPGSSIPGTTVKACPPFLDSMISGYTIFTESDLHISIEQGIPKVEWKTDFDLISTHGPHQIAKEQVPEGFSSQPFKFNNLYQIITPPGYSALFTHPQNRTDLPFFTISGIVETDVYKLAVNFPFLIRKNFTGIIPAGTPIVQVFPFKREAWKLEIGDADIDELAKQNTILNSKIF
jgi:hypothetical protein